MLHGPDGLADDIIEEIAAEGQNGIEADLMMEYSAMQQMDDEIDIVMNECAGRVSISDLLLDLSESDHDHDRSSGMSVIEIMLEVNDHSSIFDAASYGTDDLDSAGSDADDISSISELSGSDTQYESESEKEVSSGSIQSADYGSDQGSGLNESEGLSELEYILNEEMAAAMTP